MTRAGVVALLLVLGGCLEAGSFTCPDGTVCAADLVCAPVHGCAAPDRVAACESASDGDDCAVDDIPGLCVDGVCAALFCGDGRRTGNEQCDPGVSAESTCRDRGFYQGGAIGCADNCTWDTDSCAEFCGDGVLQTREELCEVGIDADGTCVSFGFDGGRLGCAGCGVDFAGCRIIGWSDASLDMGVSLTVMDVADAGDAIIAVGASGDDGAPFAARWEGTWSLVGALDPDLRPAAVWAIDSETIWVTGGRNTSSNGFAASWDGSDWTVHDLAEPGAAIWASDQGGVFVLAGSGVRSWDGRQWSYTELDPGFEGTSLAGMAESGVVYAAGYSGDIFRFDGAWAPMAVPPGVAVTDIVTDQSGALIASTLFGGIYRWDGEAWVDLELPVVPQDVILRVDGDGELVALVQWSGPSQAPQYSVFHLRAGSWRVLSEAISAPLSDLLSRAFGGFGRELFVFADAHGFQYRGTAWWTLSPPNLRAVDVWSSGVQVVLVSTTRVVKERDAEGWHGTGLSGDRVAGAGDDIYVLDSAGSQIHHRDAGGTWTTRALGVTDATDIAVRGRDDVFVLSAFGTEVDHWDGNNATRLANFGTSLIRIACAADGPCAAVGEPGSFWSSEGVPAPTQRSLFAVWVAPDGTLVVGGDYGGLWRYDGEWRSMKNASTDAITFIAGHSADDLFATAGGPGLLYHDGGDDLAWLPVRLDGQDAVIAALADTEGGLLVAGDNPGLLRLERTDPW